MIRTYKMLQERREAGEIDGFTLIELLIVIVVLGILAAVVIFALGGITSKSAVAACQADGATVQTAIAAYDNQNPSLATSVNSTALTGTANGGPYIQSFPNNGTHYTYTIITGTLNLIAPATAGSAAITAVYTSPTQCQFVQ